MTQQPKEAEPKVSGFTVIRNAELMGYPVLESIRSLLPLVDELVVGIGQSEDRTEEMIQSIGDAKIKTFSSHWDTQKTQGGLILSEKTNEALERCANDWCFYIQADEVLHEEDYAAIRQAIQRAHRDPQAEGVLFNYVHFYGSYQTIAKSRRWYRREIRVVRKSSGALSYKDAQGFRIEGRKLRVIPSKARVFHYGWVKPPELMGKKAQLLDYWWHGPDSQKERQPFFYDNQYGLRPFQDSHPAVMSELVQSQDWQFVAERKWSDWKLKDLRYFTSDVIERIFNYRIGEYRPYTLIK